MCDNLRCDCACACASSWHPWSLPSYRTHQPTSVIAASLSLEPGGSGGVGSRELLDLLLGSRGGLAWDGPSGGSWLLLGSGGTGGWLARALLLRLDLLLVVGVVTTLACRRKEPRERSMAREGDEVRETLLLEPGSARVARVDTVSRCGTDVVERSLSSCHCQPMSFCRVRGCLVCCVRFGWLRGVGCGGVRAWGRRGEGQGRAGRAAG